MHVQAAMMYKKKEENKFQFMHCYNVLKNLLKWQTKRTQLAASKTSNKKQKTDDSTPALCTPACNADESGATADPKNTEGEGRPMGRKKAKQQMRERSDQSRKESLDYLLHKKKGGQCGEGAEASRERIDLEKNKFELKRMVQEDQLLRTDTSAMSIEEQEYYRNVKKQILSRRSAQA
uniref:Uncharacterized protein K0253H11.16 n=1 Tax=Oryza sativa subsp. indica TaxID=39946 RepID=C8TFK9_ORYSI|nr:hypothetical protein [Oryza sativa Indica Group]